MTLILIYLNRKHTPEQSGFSNVCMVKDDILAICLNLFFLFIDLAY